MRVIDYTWTCYCPEKNFYMLVLILIFFRSSNQPVCSFLVWSISGYPILSMAVISQDLATVQKIYQLHRRLGVHVDDVTNEEGITPYMEAVRRDYTEIAEFLRNVGKASPLRVSHNGQTVAEVTAEFQKDKNDRIEAKIREMRMINPPRYRYNNTEYWS